jgi:hypothetical protein
LPEAVTAASQLEAFGKDLGVASREMAGVTLNVATTHLDDPIFRQWGWPIGRVEVDVRDFLEAYADGARNSPAVLHDYADHPQYGALVRIWRATPLDKRVFLLGTRADEGALEGERIRLNNGGYQPFSYLECERLFGHLCPEELVGALAASAGSVLVLSSAESRISRYVTREAEVLRAIRAGKPVAVYLTPEEFSGAVAAVGLTGGAAAGTAVVME